MSREDGAAYGRGSRNGSTITRSSPMVAVETLRLESEAAFSELLSSIANVDESHSWAVVPLKENEYLHNNASILGMAQHVAACKIMSHSRISRSVGEIS